MKIVDELLYISEDECSICRYEEADTNGICHDCNSRLDYVDLSYYDEESGIKINYSLFLNNFLNKIVDRFKFKGQSYLYKALGNIMFERAKNCGILEDIDIIIPVPMHWRAENIRGFNQSELLSKRISELSGIPYDTGAVVKIKNTPAQHLLSQSERIKNLNGSFKLKKSILSGKRILIVDDIFTTGSTVKHLSNEIRKSKPKKIEVLALTSGRRID